MNRVGGHLGGEALHSRVREDDHDHIDDEEKDDD